MKRRIDNEIGHREPRLVGRGTKSIIEIKTWSRVPTASIYLC